MKTRIFLIIACRFFVRLSVFLFTPALAATALSWILLYLLFPGVSQWYTAVVPALWAAILLAAILLTFVCFLDALLAVKASKGGKLTDEDIREVSGALLACITEDEEPGDD